MITETSGYRNVGSGAMTNEGFSGDFWSASSSSATGGSHLYLNSGNVNPQYGSDRGFGFPLRCIQGFTLHSKGRCSGRDLGGGFRAGDLAIRDTESKETQRLRAAGLSLRGR